MDIIKIIGIGFVALIIAMTLKEYKKEYAIYVSIVAGLLIISMCMDSLSQIISLLSALSSKARKQFIFYHSAIKNYWNSNIS